jgi:hypothetical protein
MEKVKASGKSKGYASLLPVAILTNRAGKMLARRLGGG